MAIIQRDDSLSRLPQTLLQMLVQKENLALQKEDQKLRQANFKLQQEESERQKALQQAAIQGAIAASSIILQRDPQAQGVAGRLSPQALPSFLENLQGFQMGDAQARAAGVGANVAEATEGAQITGAQAQARGAVADANVAEATQGADIAGAIANSRRAVSDARVAEATEGTRIEAARASLADMNIRNAIQREVLNGSDPQNGARAFAVWSEGELTWDEAREITGFSGETSIDGGRKFQPPGTAARISAEQAKAQSFLPLLRNSHIRIQQLGAGDFDGDGTPETRPIRMSVASSLQQASGSGILDLAINKISDPEQRALVQANRNFADAYRFSLSGQQSSDAERLNMMLSITETAGDDPATIAQKARMREAMIRVTAARASGQMSALQAAQGALNVAGGFNDPNISAAYQSVVDDIMEEGAPGAGPAISDIPGANSFGDVPGIIDSLVGPPGGR